MDCFADMATVFKALGDANRLRILLCLMKAPGGTFTVSQIVNLLDLSQPLVSHHLKELRHAGIVAADRKGPFIYYRLSGDEVAEIIRSVFNFLSDCGNHNGRDGVSSLSDVIHCLRAGAEGEP